MKLNYQNIIKDDNSLLREKSEPVALPLSTENQELLTAMLTYVKDSVDPQKSQEEDLRPAVGIAAIQLGIKKQMIAVAIQDENGDFLEYALVNPKIISHSVQNSYLKNGEGCLSVENMHEGYVYRHARITVKAYDLLQEKEITLRAKDYLAIVLQHEIDHLSGTLYYDHIDKTDPFKEDPEAVVIE